MDWYIGTGLWYQALSLVSTFWPWLRFGSRIYDRSKAKEDKNQRLVAKSYGYVVSVAKHENFTRKPLALFLIFAWQVIQSTQRLFVPHMHNLFGY